MDEILENWDEKKRGGKKPHILYTVPTGQNPSGATQGLERRREIYGIAQKHDVYILEDDPYYFIQMLPNTSNDDEEPKPSAPASPSAFVSALVPSFLRLDTDGRVLRMDSFSKIIAPGTRTGWVTASQQIVDRFVRAHETSLQNPSGFSQIMLFKLLREGWGHAGMMAWLFHLQLEYTRRRNGLMAACEKYLPQKIVSWSPPRAGFFVRTP
jgi:aromatic amino acid aminotransferase I